MVAKFKQISAIKIENEGVGPLHLRRAKGQTDGTWVWKIPRRDWQILSPLPKLLTSLSNLTGDVFLSTKLPDKFES